MGDGEPTILATGHAPIHRRRLGLRRRSAFHTIDAGRGPLGRAVGVGPEPIEFHH